MVFNLGTQPKPGKHATLRAIEDSLKSMRVMADQIGIKSIAIPKIGCNLGGLQWELVQEVVKETFGTWEGNLFVYVDYRKQ